MFTLHIANKNYSSWSLRPWVLMKVLEIPFKEVLHIFGNETDWIAYQKTNPTMLVPCLIDGDERIWDSLGIIEYLAEQYQGVWPKASNARTWARCATAEMHSGFFEIRNICSMNCGVEVKLNEITPALQAEVSRVEALWQEGIERFGGPYLAGDEFTAVDAFYAPLAFRFKNYGLDISANSQAYINRLLNLDAMQTWYQDGLDETFRDQSHEEDIHAVGIIIEDRRAT